MVAGQDRQMTYIYLVIANTIQKQASPQGMTAIPTEG